MGSSNQPCTALRQPHTAAPLLAHTKIRFLLVFASNYRCLHTHTFVSSSPETTVLGTYLHMQYRFEDRVMLSVLYFLYYCASRCCLSSNNDCCVLACSAIWTRMGGMTMQNAHPCIRHVEMSCNHAGRQAGNCGCRHRLAHIRRQASRRGMDLES